MKNITRQKQIPISRDKITAKDDQAFYSYFKEVLQRINAMFTDIVDNLQWSPRFFNQNSMPSPDRREIVLWKDADAAAGDPTHYIVTKDPNDNVVSFASEETA